MLPPVEINKLSGVVIRRGDMPEALFQPLKRYPNLAIKVPDAVGDDYVIPAEALANLQPYRLKEVKGIGDKRAEQIREYLKGLVQKVEQSADIATLVTP